MAKEDNSRIFLHTMVENGSIKFAQFGFTSIDEAMKNNYKVIVKTKEDEFADYYKIVRVERSVMEKCRLALVEAGVPALDANIRALVRNHYRTNDEISTELTQEEMLSKLEEIKEKEQLAPKYPVLREFGIGELEDNKEYRIRKSKVLVKEFGGVK